MAQVTLPAIGTFCWPELATRDLKAAQAFYGDLLGWRANEVPTAMGSYVIFSSGDRQAAGLCAQSDEQRQRGIPSNWLSYVSVSNADVTAAKAKELGAQILMGPFDVMEEGRMALIQDPAGAIFALWQAKNHKGVTAYMEAAALCWTELATTSAKAAQAFYSTLFGWTAQPSSDPAMPYFEWVLDGTHFGGMMEINDQWGAAWKDIPSHWMVYFMVKDVDERTSRATALGAKIRVSPRDIPKVGRFAVIEDPQGAVFSLFQGKL
jgi:predicted enzyme related to lactoylglutathione lyase